MCDFIDNMSNDMVVVILFILAVVFVLIERLRLRKHIDTVRIVNLDSDSSIPPAEKESDRKLH